jgi:hypothetical protein
MLGWNPPKSIRKRRMFIDYCGRKCFLLPARHAFPVCTRKCKLDCSGLRAAFSRAKQFGHAKVAKAAVRKACRIGCKWTKARGRCER